jgi:UMF1 family MFS transporter
VLSKLNPFSRLPNPKEVWAWGMYDLANQSFQLLINTLLFSLFVKDVIVADPIRGPRIWSYMIGASLLLVVILSPLVGALADHKAWKRELLLATGILCSLLTAALALLAPGQIWLAAALYIIAAVACGLGENFLGSFLPEISTPRTVGFVSALGWTMSYIGALLLLAIVWLAVTFLGWDSASRVRPLFVFAGLWFFAGIIPTALFLKEKARPSSSSQGTIIGGTLRRLARSARETTRFRQLARFLAVFFVYSLSTQTVIFFLGIIGDKMGFDLRDLILFALLIALTAGVAAALTARFQDRVGHRRTVSFFLGAWVIATGAMAASRFFHAPPAAFWLVSGAIGLALGGLGTSSRALVGAFTPESRAAEFFGLWGMIYKLSGAVGPLSFGAIITRFSTAANPDRGLAIGLVLLCAVFAVGLLLIRAVDESEGKQSAERAQLEDAAA